MSELRALRMRKDELETHLITLQDSRRQLMIQLEGLMKMLKVLTIKVLQTLSETNQNRITNRRHAALPIPPQGAQSLRPCRLVPHPLVSLTQGAPHKLPWVCRRLPT